MSKFVSIAAIVRLFPLATIVNTILFSFTLCSPEPIINSQNATIVKLIIAEEDTNSQTDNKNSFATITKSTGNQKEKKPGQPPFE